MSAPKQTAMRAMRLEPCPLRPLRKMATKKGTARRAIITGGGVQCVCVCGGWGGGRSSRGHPSLRCAYVGLVSHGSSVPGVASAPMRQPRCLTMLEPKKMTMKVVALHLILLGCLMVSTCDTTYIAFLVQEDPKRTRRWRSSSP